MTKFKQNQSSPEEMMAQFAALWQQKWAEMLHDKGWPTEMAPPMMGNMAFINPFMMPHMAGDGNAALHARIKELETRVAKLEKAAKPKTKTKK